VSKLGRRLRRLLKFRRLQFFHDARVQPQEINDVVAHGQPTFSPFPLLATCWMHLKPTDLAKMRPEGETWTFVQTTAVFWRANPRKYGHFSAPLYSLRRPGLASCPIVAELWTRWEHELPRIPGRSKLAEAIRDAMIRRAELDRFLDDGRLDIDTNTVERTIRPQTIIRKNALFAVLTAAGVVGRPSPRCSPPHGMT